MNISVQGTEPMRWCAGMFLLNEVKLCFLTIHLVNYYITEAVHIQFTPICKISQPRVVQYILVIFDASSLGLQRLYCAVKI
jgi:hypothetical protein